MPSSTSSSERPDTDRAGWIATGALTVALVLVTLGSWEGFWRQRGFTPSARDNAFLWASIRRQLDDAGSDVAAIIGSSRIQLGLNLDVFADATGWPKPHQLAIAMGPTVPMLRHLAVDGDFSGLVIAEINERLFFEDKRSLDWVVGAYLREYRDFGFADAFELGLRARVQETFAFRLPDLGPGPLRMALREGSWPHPDHISVKSDRSRYADFDLLPDLDARKNRTAQLRKQSKARFLSPEALAKWLDHVESLVSKLRARGGDVVLLRLPTSGFILENERETVPRTRYWDVLAARTSALAIHFEDYPSLAKFRTPDGGHLDQADARVFTRAFGEILVRALESR